MRDRMDRAKKAGISTYGKPTEMTSAPQAPKTRHTVMDGIVKGVPRGLHTPTVDGLVSGLQGPHASGASLVISESATPVPEQGFGSVPYQMARFGGRR